MMNNDLRNTERGHLSQAPHATHMISLLLGGIVAVGTGLGYTATAVVLHERGEWEEGVGINQRCPPKQLGVVKVGSCCRTPVYGRKGHMGRPHRCLRQGGVDWDNAHNSGGQRPPL